jgi:hypothetical protein
MDLREHILPFQVIQRGRNPSTKLELVKTVSPAAVLEWPLTRQKEKGWGVRAASKIPRGTFVGIYAGESERSDCTRRQAHQPSRSPNLCVQLAASFALFLRDKLARVDPHKLTFQIHL